MEKDRATNKGKCFPLNNSSIYVSDCLNIWNAFARDHFLSALENPVWTSRFVKIYKEEEFSELHAELLMVLLTSEHLSCGEGGGGEGGRNSWPGCTTIRGTRLRWLR